MKKNKKIFMFAGEPSGDLHGSHLIHALKKLDSDYTIEAVAGPLMRNEKINVFMQMEEFAVMGFSDVILSLPSLIRKFYKIRNHILNFKPDVVILIDYPGFNLRLATHLRKKGFTGKIIQYICPTVWAWGKNRIQKMNESLDLLLTIYPFEKDHFSNLPLQVEYVGHPISQTIQNHGYTSFESEANDYLIALFPGSREGEIKRNLNKILISAIKLKELEPKAKFAISIANDKVEPLIHEIINSSALSKDNFYLVPKNKTYELMRACRTAIAKSGTVTLELALHKKPTVVVYELSILNRFIAKYIMRVNLPYYCIVNILTGKETFPELIKNGFTTGNLSKHLIELSQDSEKRTDCIEECEKIRTLLQGSDAHEKAALSISKLLSS